MIEIGKVFEGALVETYICPETSRPRVRAIQDEIPKEWKVDFPKAPREEYPIGSRFRCNVKVCQKHNSDGSPKGQPYLFADKHTILHVNDFEPEKNTHAVLNPEAKSGRVYSYRNTSQRSELSQLRLEALAVDQENVQKQSDRLERTRSDKVKLYAHCRAQGICECCNNPAPFNSKKDKPYLEIHHMVELSKGGEDSPYNTAAICPNCHTEITHGVNGPDLNEKLIEYIQSKENELEINENSL